VYAVFKAINLTIAPRYSSNCRYSLFICLANVVTFQCSYTKCLSLSVSLSVCVCVRVRACVLVCVCARAPASLSVYGSTIHVDLGRFISFLIYIQSVGPLGRVGFEPMIPVFEMSKMVHALDRAATVIGCQALLNNLMLKA
jgi:hypothetical protein